MNRELSLKLRQQTLRDGIRFYTEYFKIRQAIKNSSMFSPLSIS